MLISRRSSLIALAASTEEDSQFQLYNILIKDGTMFASNGHSLFYIKGTDAAEDEYPEIDDDDDIAQEQTFIPASCFKKAVINMTKIKGRTISALKEFFHVRVSANHIKISTTDMTTTETIKVKNHSKSCTFPDVAELLKEEPDLTETNAINMSIPLLKNLVTIMEKAKVEYVTIKHTDNKSGVYVSELRPENEEQFKAILMPCSS